MRAGSIPMGPGGLPMWVFRWTLGSLTARLFRIVPPAALVAALHLPVAAQEAPFPIPRLSGSVEIDGRVDEAAWMAIPPLEVSASLPAFGRPPSERTEIRIAYDDTYLYVAGRMYDSDPGGIRATSLRRDESSLGNDWLVLNLDTFMDRRTALVFGVTPAGLRSDAIMPNDAESGGNWGWDAYWDAATTTDREGWSAEIRIPLSSLRFQEEEGRVVMGVTVWRNIARKNEIITWPAINPTSGFWSILKASQTHPVVLEGVERRNPLLVTPYALTGPSARNRRLPDAGGWVQDSNWNRDVGLDVKLSPSADWTVDLSANTDFAQVEADDQQVNLSRFSLFFPERRRFFQERGELFDFAMGGSDRLFYSRRIGLADGLPTRIYGGVRATGTLGGWDMGILDMQTAASGTTGSENAGVLRLRREVGNPGSYVGGIVTSRLESGGGRSGAAGVDALFDLGGGHYLSLATATSARGDDPGEGGERVFARARWQLRGVYGLGTDLELAHVGGGFEPTLGFLARRDHARATGSLGWGWRMVDGSTLLRQRVSTDFRGYRRYADGRLESGELTPTWYLESVQGHSLTVTTALRHEDLLRSFSIASGLSVPAGVHRNGSLRVAFDPGFTGLLRASGSLEAGGFYDGTLISGAFSPTWNASRHLELSGTYQVNRIDFPDRDQRRITHVGRLRALAMLDTQLSGIALLQYNSTADLFLVNLRIRYNPREGDDLYLVYNHGMNTDRFAFDPYQPLTDNRAFLLKYSRTLRLEW